jgi:uncharacterized membrane protein
MYEIVNNLKNKYLAYKSTLASMLAIAKQDYKSKMELAESRISGFAVTIVAAVIVIVIAVSLLPIIFSSTSTALTSNVTSNSHFAAAVTLAYLIPLVFIAGLIIVILYIMFELLGKKD